MLDEQSQREVNSVSKTTSIIVFSLCSGVIAFGGYVLFLHKAQQPPAIGILTYACLGLAGMAAISSFVLPRILARSGKVQLAAGKLNYRGEGTPDVQTDAGKLALVYQQTTIIGCALLEGAAFFALFARMTEGHLVSLIVAGVMLIGIAGHMPLGGRLSSWVETQLRTIEEEKNFSALN